MTDVAYKSTLSAHLLALNTG